MVLGRAGGAGALVLPVLITMLVLAGGFMLAAPAPTATAAVVVVVVGLVVVSIGGHPVGLHHLAAATILCVDVLQERKREGKEKLRDREEWKMRKVRVNPGQKPVHSSFLGSCFCCSTSFCSFHFYYLLFSP